MKYMEVILYDEVEIIVILGGSHHEKVNEMENASGDYGHCGVHYSGIFYLCLSSYI